MAMQYYVIRDLRANQLEVGMWVRNDNEIISVTQIVGVAVYFSDDTCIRVESEAKFELIKFTPMSLQPIIEAAE